MPWDTVGDEIHHRLMDPAKFTEGSFRRIDIKKDKPRVFGVIGRLKGETTTTLQALRFPVGDGWTVAGAKDWTEKTYPKSRAVKEADMELSALKGDNYEVRDVEVEEIRVDEQVDGGPVIRVALKFNSLSLPMGKFNRFREQLAPTAFDAALNDPELEVLSFWNHNTDLPLGRRSAGTVAISKSATLFKADIHPGDTSWAVDAVKAIRRKDVRGTSFGFRVSPQGETWEEDAKKNLIRTLTSVELVEISPTPMPAYPASAATLRSYEAALNQFQASDEERNALAAAQIAARQWRDRLHCSSLRRR